MLYPVAFMVLALLIAGCAPSPQLSIPVTGDVERGAQLFVRVQGEMPPCSTCHRVTPDQVGFSVGPNLAGIGERAETRLEGFTANEYLLQSIIEPGHYVVTGYRDFMYAEYKTHFSDQDLLDLLAYLLSL